MSRDIQKMGAAEFTIRGIPFLYAAAITHELHWPRDAARHTNNGARRVATVRHSMPALHTNYSGRATYNKWDGATSTSAASHFSYGAALHAKLHQPGSGSGSGRPGSRVSLEPGSREPGSWDPARAPESPGGRQAPRLPGSTVLAQFWDPRHPAPALHSVSYG